MIRQHIKTLKPGTLITASMALALFLAIFFPMVTDEAYYLDWARRPPWPALGFFDHPPFVSWLATGARIWHHIAAARIVVWLSSLVSFYFVWKTAKILIPERAPLTIALLATSVGGIACGFLLTPDTGLNVMWSIAIHEAALALRENPRRWLTAGIATGMGLLSKYTMVIIGPVFLWGLIRDARKQLLTPWPYLGGALCLMVFLPHLWWQNENNWVTFKFQVKHGFSVKQARSFESTLPVARNPEIDSANMVLRNRLFASMSSTAGFAELAVKSKPEPTRWEKAWQYTGDYIGGVAGLWGLYAILAVVSAARSIKSRVSIPVRTPPKGFALIEASAFFPLIFFGMLSPFTKIEANWPAMHMSALAIWICSRHVIPIGVMLATFLTHLAVIATLTFALINPGAFPGARDNRILLESRGFRALGEWVRDNDSGLAIAVDSYQLKSAIRYYSPATPVAQWPGITRGSEYTRNAPGDRDVESKILAQRELTIIAMSSFPPVIDGFEAVSFSGIRVCPDGTMGIFSESSPTLPCEKGLREWWITQYRAATHDQNPR